MMDLATQAIVDRLALLFGEGWTVDHFPDVPDRYQFSSAEKTLLVSYEGSTYSELEAMSPMSTPRDAEFGVTLLVRSLRGPEGVAATIDNVRKFLMGWRPTTANDEDPPAQVPIGLGPLAPTKDALIGEDQGVWRFVVMFKARTVVVQDTQPLTGPAITATTINESTTL